MLNLKSFKRERELRERERGYDVLDYCYLFVYLIFKQSSRVSGNGRKPDRLHFK